MLVRDDCASGGGAAAAAAAPTEDGGSDRGTAATGGSTESNAVEYVELPEEDAALKAWYVRASVPADTSVQNY